MRSGACLVSCSSPSPPPSAAATSTSSYQHSHSLSFSFLPFVIPSITFRRLGRSLPPFPRNTFFRNIADKENKSATNDQIMVHHDDVPVDYSAAAEESTLLKPKTKFLTLPTVLTLARVAAIPFLLCAFYSNEWWAKPAVPSIFVLAAVTDWLDGFLARKMGSNSTFGAFLDPVADKLMVATTLVLLCTKPLGVSWAATFPWLIPLPSTAIIGREITMSAVREWAASQGGDLQSAVAVNNLGKWKTASQLVALTALLATRNVSSEIGIAHLVAAFGIVLLYISAGLALLSLAAYMKAVWGSLIK